MLSIKSSLIESSSLDNDVLFWFAYVDGTLSSNRSVVVMIRQVKLAWWLIKNWFLLCPWYLSLTPNHAAPNPTYSVRGSDLTTFENRSSRPPKMVQKWNFNFLSKFSSNFKQLLFSWQCGKNHLLDHFCTTKDSPYYLYLPYIGWPRGGGGSDLITFENKLSDNQKWSEKWFSAFLSNQKLLEI